MPPNNGRRFFTSATTSPASATFVHPAAPPGHAPARFPDSPATGTGTSRSKIRFRIPNGDPKVTRPRTGHSGWAHSASYATTDPSECPTITRVPSSTPAATRSCTCRAHHRVRHVPADLLQVKQHRPLSKPREERRPAQRP